MYKCKGVNSSPIKGAKKFLPRMDTPTFLSLWRFFNTESRSKGFNLEYSSDFNAILLEPISTLLLIFYDVNSLPSCYLT